MASDNLIDSWERFRADAARWVRPEQVAELDEVTPRVILKLMLKNPSLRAMAWFRLGSAMRAAGVRALPHWTQQRIRRVYGLELPVGADYAGGLYIAHTVGCVLVAQSIGANVTVVSQVTFGTRGDTGWPIIEAETFFGTGARILGGITVGQGAIVGANAVVLRDVKANSTVVGVPAREL